MTRRVTVVLVVTAAIGAGACSDDEGDTDPRAVRVDDPGAVHVHGLGVNPADGALFVATHTGLFRAGPGERRTERVAGRFQDTMGFAVVGPDRFLGSGHPDGREELPPFLGLISSQDAGQTWEPVSLLGERDFHVLEASGRRIYGYGSDFDTGQEGLLVSSDGGRGWRGRAVPEPLMSLAIDPRDGDRVLAAGEQGLYLSGDAGRRWRSLTGQPGLLTSTRDGTYRIGVDGRVSESRDGGVRWRFVGDAGGPPSAFDSGGGDLYVALHDGRVTSSRDGGRTWKLRSRP